MQSSRYFVQLHQTFLGTRPIACYVLDEKWGTVAQDWVTKGIGGAHNGTYNSDVSGWPVDTGCGDGKTAPIFSGNDLVTLPAAFRSAVNTTVGSALSIWRCTAWDDGSTRFLYYIETDANNAIGARKLNAPIGFYQLLYVAGGTLEVVQYDAASTPDWIMSVLTWDRNAGATGEVRGYHNGVQFGGTQVGLGNWVGAIATALIGARSGPAGYWIGSECYVMMYDYALTPATVMELYDEWQGQ